MIQNTEHHLSFEQIQFLNRGPTYIIPAQIHLFSKNRTIKELLLQQFLPLRKQTQQIFTKYSLHRTQQEVFQSFLETQFLRCFSQSIPIGIQQRALYEKQLIQSIQLQLQQNHLILRRTADNYNTFYLGHRNDFNRLAQDQIETSSCYEMMGTIDSISTDLTRIQQSIDAILQQLVNRNLLLTEYFKKLELSKETNLKLPYLYFLPKTHQNGHVQLQPRLSSCKHAPVRTLTTFLDQLIRPLYENCCQATTFLDGHDFIQRLEQYCLQSNCLTLNTKFVTFELHNLYTHTSHEDLLVALNRFLLQHLPSYRYQRLSTQTIGQLTKLTLENHLFTYKNKLYRYIKGSPLNYAFTQLLFDIYLHNWQLVLVRYIRITNQFYGRYHNRGIFTWNESHNGLLSTLIKQLNVQNPNIQLTISTGIKVNFLQAHIENRQGILYTRVYQDPLIQPFLLPYAAEHPRLLHRQWFRFCLARAMQYCPSYDDFQEQSLQIQLTFLANGYSLDFVHYHLEQFFKRFQPAIHNFVYNRMHYNGIRQQVFRYYNQKKFEFKQAQQQQQQQQQPLSSIPRSISFYYLYDWGNRIQFNRKFREYWSTIILQDRLFARFAFKVILRSKYCFSSNTLLAQYKENNP